MSYGGLGRLARGAYGKSTAKSPQLAAAPFAANDQVLDILLEEALIQALDDRVPTGLQIAALSVVAGLRHKHGREPGIVPPSTGEYGNSAGVGRRMGAWSPAPAEPPRRFPGAGAHASYRRIQPRAARKKPAARS